MPRSKRDVQTLGDIFQLPSAPAPEAVLVRVRRLVASHAHGAEDCRLLLEALGLTAEHGTDGLTAPAGGG
ncbi:hypothetical protein [Kitasatospora camelliae]|uniref:Uncharacterized protein n=1 Tax=Kitasatospora camelliae TaxID=3156397 RepID=A0AAU8JS50_9ACTN